VSQPNEDLHETPAAESAEGVEATADVATDELVEEAPVEGAEDVAAVEETDAADATTEGDAAPKCI
jgi:hypothetical protein